MNQVRWLNGDPHERVSLDDSEVRILGKLEKEPGSVRTRREAIFESDNLRRQNDISRIERQRRAKEKEKVDMIKVACSEALDFLVEEVVTDICVSGSIEHADRIKTWMALNFDFIFDFILDALIKVTDLVVDDLIMATLISVSSEHFERVKIIEAIKLIAKVLKQNVIRKRLLKKWGSYISNELHFAKGVSKLDHAARLIKSASPLISRLKFPVSQLVGRGEIGLLEKYAPSVPKIHSSTAMNEVTSRRILQSKTAVASALGSALRESFLDHAAYTRTLHVAKTNDPSHVPNVESEREAAISTPCMSPLHAFVHNMAAPSIALRPSAEPESKKISKSGFEIRREKFMCLINNAIRAINSPRHMYPVFESVGKDLSTTAPASQLNRIANDWGVSTTHSTAIETNDILGDVYTDAFNAEFKIIQGDADVHSIRNTSDNVGHGSAKRFETTTQHHHVNRYSKLPPTMQGIATSASAKSWNSMMTSGIHKKEDLSCSQKSDVLLRLCVIMQMKEIDEALPNSPPNHIGDMPTRAASVKCKTATRIISEMDYKTTIHGEESFDPIEVTRTISNKASFKRGSRPSVLEQDNKIHPQIPETFSKDSTLIKLIMQNHKNCHPKGHAEAGDGAPIHSLLKLQRVALHILRQEQNGHALDDEETEELLTAIDVEDEVRDVLEISDNDSDSSGCSMKSNSSSVSNSSAVAVETADCGNTRPVHNSKRVRKPASKLKPEQAKVLCSGMILVLGVWHCMQESILVNLDGHHDEWSHFIPLWRATEGRVNFLLGGGSVKDALHELFSAVAGMVKFLANRFRLVQSLEHDVEIDYSDLDEFIDQEVERSTVFAKLRSLIEVTILTKLIYDSMRQGMLSLVWLLLEQLVELCAATGKFKYMRLITELRVLHATMPLADLLFLVDNTFTDMGSYFAPTDEFTEIIHWLYEKLAGRRRERGWVSAVTRLSTTLASQEPGRNLGTSSGAHLPPSGFRSVDIFIASRVQEYLENAIKKDGWLDKDGKFHSHDERYGFGGALPLHATDIQRVGRAVLEDDVSKIIFGGKSASSVRRSNPVRITLSAAAECKRSERREKQINATTSVDIEKTSYTKLEMSQDIDAYAAFIPRSDAVVAVLSGSDKQLFVPRSTASRPQLAAALSRWRALDRQHCAMAHKSSATESTDIDRRIIEQPSTLSRRAAARASLRSQGKLYGLTMARNTQVTISSSCETEVPPGQLLASWLEAHRNIPASSSRHGETGLKNAQEFVNASKASVGDEDCVAEIQSLKRSLKKLNDFAITKTYVGGRDQQMQAARTFRRVVEIEGLFEERQRRMKMEVPWSPWSDGTLEPPAVSMGNAVAWRPSNPMGDRPPLQVDSGSSRHGYESATPADIATPAPTRRPPVCSCCSQIRSLGHVRICSHTNKTCSRCRHQATPNSDPLNQNPE
jgi:hypothetical protein